MHQGVLRRPFRAWLVLLLLASACVHPGAGTARCPLPPERRIPAAAGRSERTWARTDSVGVIEGALEDWVTGAPLTDLQVVLVGRRPNGSVYSNAQGGFRFTRVTPGTHVLVIWGRYPEVRDTLVVSADRGLRGRIRLEPSHPEYDCVVETR